MGYKMYVVPNREQEALFYKRLFRNGQDMTKTIKFHEFYAPPYKITGPLRINPVARAVRVALGPRSLADIQDRSRVHWPIVPRHIEVKS